MTVFVEQLVALIITALASILFLLEIVGVAVPYISDPDGFWTGSPPIHDPIVTFKIPMTMKRLILIGLIVAGLATLALTYFDLCSFLRFWFPETRGGLPLRCP